MAGGRGGPPVRPSTNQGGHFQFSRIRKKPWGQTGRSHFFRAANGASKPDTSRLAPHSLKMNSEIPRVQLGKPKYSASALVKSVVAMVVPTLRAPDEALPIILPSHLLVRSPIPLGSDA